MRRTLGGAALVATLVGCEPAPPPGGYTLLFLGRSPAASVAGRSWAPDPAKSRILGFDRALHVARELRSPRLATPMAVAPFGPAALLVTEHTGEGVVVDTAGREVREWESLDAASLYATGGGRVVATRSPYYVPELAVPAPDTAPLIRVLDTLGHPAAGIATLRRPAVAYLSYLVNAGAVAADQNGAVYYAPLVRDEIVKYGPGGTRHWTTKRGLFPRDADPVFVEGRGALTLRQALVNVALDLGPDGRLYALGGDDSSATALRLDVLDTATGRIVATRHLGARDAAIALGPNGTVALFDRDSLLAGTGGPPSAREAFAPPFALPDLTGRARPSSEFLGKVTLVNFWASWCDPCREEFPHMTELYRAYPRADFEIVAISDDVDESRMRAFVRRFRPPFPILVGAGRMKATYHYRGLPYSVLLDRRGRVIERIFGFGGAEEFRGLRETIAKEVPAP